MLTHLRRAARVPHIDRLEPRTLLSAATEPAAGLGEAVAAAEAANTIVELIDGDLWIRDLLPGGKNDRLVLARGSSDLVIRDDEHLLSSAIPGAAGDGTHALQVPWAPLGGRIVVQTGGGDDMVTIRLTGHGAPVTSGGLDLEGGTGAGDLNDTLVVVGNTVASARYRAADAAVGSGRLTIDGAEVAFTGVDSVTMSRLAVVTLQTPGDSDALTLDNTAAGTIVVHGTSAGGAGSSPIVPLTFFDVGQFILDAATHDAGGSDLIAVHAAHYGLDAVGGATDTEAEAEPNDQPAGALPLAADLVGTGSVADGDDLDLWAVSDAVEAGQVVYAWLDTQRSPDAAPSTLDLLSGDGATGIAQSHHAPGYGSILAGATVPAGHDGLLLAAGADGPVDAYDLLALVVDADDIGDEVEPNDRFGAGTDATPVTATAMMGRVEPGSGDLDVYRFFATRGSRIAIVADEDPERDGLATDLLLLLLNPGHTQVVAVSPGLAPPNAAEALGVFTAPETGEYQLLITDLGRSDPGAGSYRFGAWVLGGGLPLADVTVRTGSGNDALSADLPFRLAGVGALHWEPGAGADELTVRSPSDSATDQIIEVGRNHAAVLGALTIDYSGLGAQDHVWLEGGDGPDTFQVTLPGTPGLATVHVDGGGAANTLAVIGAPGVPDRLVVDPGAGRVSEANTSAATIAFDHVTGGIVVRGQHGDADTLEVLGRPGEADEVLIGPDSLFQGRVRIDPALPPVQFDEIAALTVVPGDGGPADHVIVNPMAIPVTVDAGSTDLSEPDDLDTLTVATPDLSGLSTTIPGLAQSEAGGFIPPDPIGAAGPLHNVAIVNTALALYDKQTGAVLAADSISGTDGFFGRDVIGGNAHTTVFDPKVLFDPHGQRFILVALESDRTTFSHTYVAVSTTATPSNLTTDWIRFRLDTLNRRGAEGSTQWLDYPGLGVDETAVYITGNMFDGVGYGNSHVALLALDKAGLLAGVVEPLADVELPAAFTVQPALSYGGAPSGTAYFVGNVDVFSATVSVYALDPATGLLHADRVDLPPAILGSHGALHLDGGLDYVPLDAVAARIMNVVYRDGSLWAAHAVDDMAHGPADREAEVRWYEIAANERTGSGDGAPPSMVQHGVVDPGPGLETFMPAINVNARGDMAIGFSVAGPSAFAGAAYTGRRATDPPGWTAPIHGLHAGEGPYQPRLDSVGRNRWGDYTGLSVDPVDESFWVFNEYASSLDSGGPHTGSWATVFGRFEIASGPLVVTASAAGAGTIERGGFAPISYAGFERLDADQPPAGPLHLRIEPEGPAGSRVALQYAADDLHLSIDDLPVGRFDLPSFASITVIGTDQPDDIVVALDGETSLLAAGLTVDGGGGHDTLRLEAAAMGGDVDPVHEVVHAPADGDDDPATHDGRIAFGADASIPGAATIAYVDVELVVDEVPATHRRLDIGDLGEAQTVHLGDDATPGDGRSRLEDPLLGRFAPVRFLHPQATLTLAATDGADHVIVSPVDAGAGAGGGFDLLLEPGGGADHVQLDGGFIHATHDGGTSPGDADVFQLGPDQRLSGYGTVTGAFAGDATATVAATGPLALGDGLRSDGFVFHGTLDVGAHVVDLADADEAALGRLTTMGAGGRLVADNGAIVDAGDTFTGAGTVAGALTVSAGGTVATGFDAPVSGLLSGGLNLRGDARLAVTLSADTQTPSGHAALDVAGAVRLGGAVLEVTLDVLPEPGDGFLLIANDGTDSVDGRFHALPEGATIVAEAPGGARVAMAISYRSGNDVVLVMTSPALVHVDDDWLGLPLDTDPDGPDGPATRMGFDAFATIAAAVNAVADEGTVRVAGGRYEETVIVDRAVAMLGDVGDASAGAGPDAPLLTGLDLAASTGLQVAAAAPAVRLEGFTLADWSASAVTVNGGDLAIVQSTILNAHEGVRVGPGNIALDGVLISGPADVGVLIDDDGHAAVARSRLSGHGSAAVRVVDGSADVSQSLLTGNHVAMLVDAAGSAVVHDSDLSSSGERAIRHEGAIPLDASVNWWGSDDDAQVAPLFDGLVDFTPMLATGTDTAIDPMRAEDAGFQGDRSRLAITARGTQLDGAGRVQEGIDTLLPSGGSLLLAPGTYVESDIRIDRPAVISGATGHAGDVLLAPALADTGGARLFSAGAHSALIIAHDDVSIAAMTIDGAASPDLGPGDHYRGAVVIDPADPGGPVDRATITNVAMRNLRTVGIYLDGGVGTRGTGHVVSDNDIAHIGGAGVPTGVLLIQADALVSDNFIRHVDVGIGSNHVDGVAHAPRLTVRGNELRDVDVGMNLSGLADGSLIDGDTIALPAVGPQGSADNVGIIVQMPAGTVSIAGNVVTGSGPDAALWLLHQPDPQGRMLVTGNTFTSTDSTIAALGEGTGILITDDGTLLGSGTSATHAALAGNTVSGFVVGVHLYQEGDGVDVSFEDNIVTGSTVAINLVASDAAAPARLRARFMDDLAGLIGNAYGINMEGAELDLADASVSATDTAIRVGAGAGLALRHAVLDGDRIGLDVDGGTALVASTDFNGSAIGLRVVNGGVVDAGQEAPGFDLTGFGVSGGGNDFASFTGEATATSGAIVDLNPVAGPGPQGPPLDVLALGNVFVAPERDAIEAVVHHDVDDRALGYVVFAELQGLTLDLASHRIREGQTAVLHGRLEGEPQTHSVVIDWGDGTEPDVLDLPPEEFTFQAEHVYDSDDTTAAPFDVYRIDVVARAGLTGHRLAQSTSITVDNVAPTVTLMVPAGQFEGAPATVSAEVFDPGRADTFDFDWSARRDGVLIAVGDQPAFSFTPDDDGLYDIHLVVTDGDGSSGEGAATLPVSNVAPTIPLLGAAEVEEGRPYDLTLGQVADPGTDAVARFVISWGDGTLEVLQHPGPRRHIYADDALATGPITVTLVDEDGTHADAGTLHRMVRNVPPTAGVFTGPPVNEGTGTAVLFVNQGDISAVDAAAGFSYGYDFNADGDFDDPGEIAWSTSPSATVPGDYLDDDPGHVVRLVIRDKDGGETEILQTLVIRNVAPSVDAGADARASEGTAAFVNVPFRQEGRISDPGADDWTVTIDYGDGTPPLPGAVVDRRFVLEHAYVEAGTYTIGVVVDDGDGGVASDQVIVEVVDDTFRVVGFAGDATGFDLRFNRPADPSSLALYHSTLFAPTGSNGASVSLRRDDGAIVAGSVMWDEATNTLSFLPTGQPLGPGQYRVVAPGDPGGLRDRTGRPLDGDDDGSDGGDFVVWFTVDTGLRRLWLTDFAGGPGQAVAGLPIRIDDATDVVAVDFQLRYDPQFLAVDALRRGSDLPASWTLLWNLVAPGWITVTAWGTTALNGSDLTVAIVEGTVPAAAPYGQAHRLALTDSDN